MTSSTPPPGRRRPWIATAIAIVTVVVLVSILGSAWLWSRLYVDRIGDPPSRVHFVVSPGSSLRQVARELEAAGLCEQEWYLRAVARLEGSSRAVRAGEYEVEVGASPARLLQLFVEGKQITRAVTVPEGWTAQRTVQVLADSLDIDPTELDRFVQSPPQRWRERLGIPENQGLEGYLFPETYRFTRGTGAREVIDVLLGTLDRALDDSLRARVERSRFDLHQVITLASIVEAEATQDDERPLIAAVYLNRLEQGWKLEADPTVAYAVGKIGERLLYRDLESESPYNTYRVTGLPPGPINSPGLASIRAVLEPAPDFDAMYFVADGNGGHRFSRTWEEHRRAVELYRQVLREQRARDGSD